MKEDQRTVTSSNKLPEAERSQILAVCNSQNTPVFHPVSGFPGEQMQGDT
ncbi:MAG: hypothetical protein COB33_015700 [Thiotrichaceae bacterium]|nr:hypothetical protein [Thiotrichaceae bacterium]